MTYFLLALVLIANIGSTHPRATWGGHPPNYITARR